MPVKKPKAAVPTNYSYKVGAKQNLVIQQISRSLLTKSLLELVKCSSVYKVIDRLAKIKNMPVFFLEERGMKRGEKRNKETYLIS